jgi:putative transposase
MNPEKHPVQEFEISDALWARIEPLLPVREKPVHPLGCHRPRESDRKVLNSIFYLLRTGGQWQSLNSLDSTRYARRSTAHTRFQEWLEDGFFARLWEASLLDYDEMQGLDFEWMALDGAMTKAPLGGEKKRPLPLRPRQRRRQAQPPD